MSDYALFSLFAPSLLFGGLLCIGYASIYHLWGGESLRDLALFMLVACAGFFIGQMIGFVAQFELFKIGQLYLIEGTIGAWLLLIGFQSIRA